MVVRRETVREDLQRMAEGFWHVDPESGQRTRIEGHGQYVVARDADGHPSQYIFETGAILGANEPWVHHPPSDPRDLYARKRLFHKVRLDNATHDFGIAFHNAMDLCEEAKAKGASLRFDPSEAVPHLAMLRQRVTDAEAAFNEFTKAEREQKARDEEGEALLRSQFTDKAAEVQSMIAEIGGVSYDQIKANREAIKDTVGEMIHRRGDSLEFIKFCELAQTRGLPAAMQIAETFGWNTDYIKRRLQGETPEEIYGNKSPIESLTA